MLTIDYCNQALTRDLDKDLPVPNYMMPLGDFFSFQTHGALQHLPRSRARPQPCHNPSQSAGLVWAWMILLCISKLHFYLILLTKWWVSFYYSQSSRVSLWLAKLIHFRIIIRSQHGWKCAEKCAWGSPRVLCYTNFLLRLTFVWRGICLCLRIQDTHQHSTSKGQMSLEKNEGMEL